MLAPLAASPAIVVSFSFWSSLTSFFYFFILLLCWLQCNKWHITAIIWQIIAALLTCLLLRSFFLSFFIYLHSATHSVLQFDGGHCVSQYSEKLLSLHWIASQSFLGEVVLQTHHTESLSPQQSWIWLKFPLECMLTCSVIALHCLTVCVLWQFIFRSIEKKVDSEPLFATSVLLWHWQIHTHTLTAPMIEIEEEKQLIGLVVVVVGCRKGHCATLCKVRRY